MIRSWIITEVFVLSCNVAYNFFLTQQTFFFLSITTASDLNLVNISAERQTSEMTENGLLMEKITEDKAYST